ncbi:endo alpha-1,4 polygalactosaminidase [Nitratifractor salsuginis]|uniref:TM1410 hypothetical-related protein n=1 Tax=Nitratifractor salsuginis (strain DSM 16511 / JCM 12458 / E9I37-1) TaxID=749222 RepID=E6X332_NITSE|nr:endo alpha-1,4 polygalactosaminidase [Nitratifractor salsuginis]ADV46176.1 TM1410 hypothetical-related protein [Nitratifractor salsuginis DSM 16511]
MRRVIGVGLAIVLFTGCGGGGGGGKDSGQSALLHRSITSTIFWVGEEAGPANGGISNQPSAWDGLWTLSYGGVDDPEHRNGYLPAGFIPYENPFYVALPFNDLDEQGQRKKGLKKIIPWYNDEDPRESLCKNHWVEISKDGKTVYAQWEDAGPFETNDSEYVFGTARPKNRINDHAGIDLSPAIRDYLGVEDIDRVDWRFVDESEVPEGPWKEIVTRSGVHWPDPDAYIPPESRWQWQLQGDLNTSYDVDYYDIDLFDTQEEEIRQLHSEGQKVICYFSAGSWESWRPDAEAFPERVKGRKMDRWDELWLDIRDPAVRSLMKKRLDLALGKGCDGVEPDNVDGYANETGFNLSARDQIDYNRFLAREAHKRGLSIGLKNDLEQVKVLEPWFDFALNEQCHEYGECDRLSPFIEAGKAVFNAEYAEKYVKNTDGARDALCQDAKERKFSTLVLPRELDGSFRYSCD